MFGCAIHSIRSDTAGTSCKISVRSAAMKWKRRFIYSTSWKCLLTCSSSATKTGPSAGSVRESEIGFKHIIQAISRLFSSTQHMEGAPVNLWPEWHLYGVSDMRRKVLKLRQITPASIKLTRRRTYRRICEEEREKHKHNPFPSAILCASSVTRCRARVVAVRDWSGLSFRSRPTMSLRLWKWFNLQDPSRKGNKSSA